MPTDPAAGFAKHYHTVEVTGQNGTLAAAIDTALDSAKQHYPNIRWFEVTEIRGRPDDQVGWVYQVTIKIGYEDKHDDHA